MVFGMGEVSPAGWAGPAESSVGLGESPCGVVFQAVMVSAERAEVPGCGGSFRPWGGVVEVCSLCGVLAAGEPAGVVAGADEVVECGWWPVGVPGVFDKCSVDGVGDQSFPYPGGVRCDGPGVRGGDGTVPVQ